MDRFAHIEVPTFGDIIRAHAARDPDAVALRFAGRVTTYGELDRLTNRIANSLIRDGVRPGARVAYLIRNSDDIALVAVGAAKAGAVFVPVNARLAGPEIDFIVRHSTAEVMFHGEGFADIAATLAADMTGLRTLRIDPLRLDDDWLSHEETDARTPVDPRDVAVQVYTSGTTGRPKGAMLSHRSLFGVAACRKATPAPWDTWGPQDVTLQALPLAHVGGFGMLARALFFGAESVILREFEPGAVLDAIEHQRISKIGLVPTAIAAVLEHPRARKVDYGRINTFIYGAAPIQLELLKAAVEVFRCGFAQSYGMTETASTIVVLPPKDHVLEGSPRMRAAGLPLPGVELRIVDAAGAPQLPGVVGEVSVRAISNMVGYWNDPKADAEVFEPDGWLRTGDAGYLDADGYLFISDRIKDVIISGAANIYPAEVESAIYGHPDLAEVAVIGVPDDRWGETVKAVVVLKPGHSLDADGVIAWARERIASYKLPRSVDVVDALPLNASGKVQRRALRQRYWEGRDRQV